MGEWGEFVGFVAHVESEEWEHFVFPDCPFFVDAASAAGLGLTGAECDWEVVDFAGESAFMPESD